MRKPTCSPPLPAEIRHPAEQLGLFRLPLPEAAPPARHVVLGGRAIAYRLRSGGGRRRLSLRVDEAGLTVGAPRGVRVGEIEGFIREHGDWICRKLAELAAAPSRHAILRDGTRLPLLDGECTLRLSPGANRVRWVADTLLLEARPGADLGALATRGLQRRALAHFGERLRHFAPRLDLAPPALALTSARTRWGSCSRVGGIRINWRLIHLPAHLGDYVVAHELAHLHEMNHGPRFWRWVGHAYPEWESARAALRGAGRGIPIL